MADLDGRVRIDGVRAGGDAVRPWTIEGVRVGRPASLGKTSRGDVVSAIRKTVVDRAQLFVSLLNLDGDDQADRSSHGGPDKAVLVMPSEHYGHLRFPDATTAGFGENVTTSGAIETEVTIGTTVRWGDAVLQVSQPRSPCFKLGMHTGAKTLGPLMIDSGRCGWYMRVLEPGTVPTAGVLGVVDQPSDAPTVAEAFAAMFAQRQPPISFERVQQIASCPALAEQWSTGLLARRANT